MNNIGNNIKNLLLNKNAVTILCTLVGVLALWLVYNKTLTKAVSPIRVPVATRNITAGTLITAEDFKFVEVSSDFAKKASIITSSSKLLNHYVNNGTSIAKGAMFYTSQVVTKDNLIKRDIELTDEGQKLYWLKVDNTSTYANSIYPGDKIDLWIKVKTRETDNLFVYQEFITGISVLGVLDSKGQNVFDVTDGSRAPAWLEFAVDTEMYKLLYSIDQLGGMQLFPVPKNKLYSGDSTEMKYASESIKDLIRSLVIDYGSE